MLRWVLSDLSERVLREKPFNFPQPPTPMIQVIAHVVWSPADQKGAKRELLPRKHRGLKGVHRDGWA